MSGVQSWLDAVRTSSHSTIEQVPLEIDLLDPVLVPLPSSATTKNGSSNPGSGSLQHTHQSHTQSGLSHPPAGPTGDRISQSDQAHARAAISTTRPRSGTATTSFNSLRQLQLASAVAEDQLPLPESRPGSVTTLRSAATIASTRPRTSAQAKSVDSLLQLQTADNPVELRIPLPDSVATTVSEDASTQRRTPVQATSVDSLLQLQTADTPLEFRTPLPDSVATTVSEGTQRTSSDLQSDQQSVNIDYWTKIGPLLDCLPHLQAVDETNGRHRNKASVSCMDYIRGELKPRMHRKLRAGKQLMESVRSLKRVADPDVITRVILIEDLSPEVIESIGSVFGVDPEFFAEHLNRSGYGGMDYDDPLPSHWMSETKAHISLKWYRPVLQNPKVTQWMQDPGALLDLKERTLKKNSMVSTNMAPGSISWFDSSYTADGRKNEDANQHEAVISTNIFRPSWTLSTRPPSESPETGNERRVRPPHRKASIGRVRSANDVELDWKHDAVPTAWEEKASFFRYNHGAVPIVLLLLDPLPSISDYQKPLDAQRKKRRAGSSVGVSGVEMKIDMSVPILPRLPSPLPINKFEASIDDIRSLEHDTRNLASTAKALRSQSAVVPGWKAFEADPILGLLRVVQLDSRAFFDSLEWALDEIGQDSLDEYLMSRRLGAWRKLMSDFEMAVPAIGKSLHDFTTFVFADGMKPELPKEIRIIIESVDADIIRIESRLAAAYTTLRADTQSFESRRSITETKTVTKLTELAFLFIPLSFTASLFSMSIQELDTSVPVWTFIATSLGMAALAYGVRLMLTSEYLAKSLHGAFERFRAQRGLPRGANAPIFTIALFTLREIWQNGAAKVLAKALMVLFGGSLIVVPIAFAWTSTSLDVGFQAAVSLFLVLSSLGLAFCFSDAAGGEYMTAWARGSDESDDGSGSV